MDTFYNHSPITNNTQGEIANMTSFHFTISPSHREIASMTSKRSISLDIMEETINGFNELPIQSTINNSAYDNSEEDDAEMDPNINPKVATYTKNGNSPHILLTNR